MDSSFTKKLEAIPKIPQDFGEDGGMFHKYYDNLADELDDDMVTSLKSQLDGILIFVSISFSFGFFEWRNQTRFCSP